jgi:hypothetical protein
MGPMSTLPPPPNKRTNPWIPATSFPVSEMRTMVECAQDHECLGGGATERQQPETPACMRTSNKPAAAISCLHRCQCLLTSLFSQLPTARLQAQQQGAGMGGRDTSPWLSGLVCLCLSILSLRLMHFALIHNPLPLRPVVPVFPVSPPLVD